MLTKVEVISVAGDTLAFPLSDFASSGYLIKDITGLDPVRAEQTATKQAQMDGTKRQSSSRDNRNIVLHLGFIPEFTGTTVQELRRRLYPYLIPKSIVTLRFYMDNIGFVDIQGEVETFEAPLFTADPTATISIICNDPDFYALASVVFDGLTTSGATETGLTYTGSTPAGFIFVLPITRTLAGFSFYNTIPGNFQQEFDVVSSLLNGDTVTIDTTPGNKSIKRTRTGVDTSILADVSPASIWPLLMPGLNSIRVQASGSPAMPYTITYTAKHGGL